MQTVYNSVGKEFTIGIKLEAIRFIWIGIYSNSETGIAFPETYGSDGTTAIRERVKTDQDIIIWIAVELWVFQINGVV